MASAGVGVAAAAGTGMGVPGWWPSVVRRVGAVCRRRPRGRCQHRREEAPATDETPALTLKLSRMMTPPPRGGAPRPIFLNALRMGGEVDREFNAEGHEANCARSGRGAQWKSRRPIGR